MLATLFVTIFARGRTQRASLRMQSTVCAHQVGTGPTSGQAI